MVFLDLLRSTDGHHEARNAVKAADVPRFIGGEKQKTGRMDFYALERWRDKVSNYGPSMRCTYHPSNTDTRKWLPKNR
jgi:hypothetical protein